MPTQSANRSHTLRASFRFGGCALALVGAVALLTPACGGDDTTTGGTAGSGGSTGSAGKGGSGGTGGSTDAGKAGSSGTAGASGSGGASGTAGAGGAGAAGKGGAAGMAGAAGTAGKGGAAGTGGAAGSAGTAGTAGSAGTGGAGGSAGTGGTAGSAGSGVGDAGPDISSDGSIQDAPLMCVDAGGPLAPDAARPDAAPDEDNCADPDGGRIINPFLTCPDAAAPGDGGMDTPVAVHSGTSADDDDCKTHVTYSTTCIQRNQNVTFTVTQKDLTSSTNSTGGNPYIEAFIGTHPITNAGTTTENNGVYTISGVQFDRAGIWTVRFHFFANCEDGDDSKHTHVAFYVVVP